MFQGFPGASVPAATAADVENKVTGSVSVLVSAAEVAHTADEATAGTFNLNVVFHPCARGLPSGSGRKWLPGDVVEHEPGTHNRS